MRKVCSGPLLLPYSRELELRTVGLLQDHVIGGNFQLINCRCERCLDLNSVLVTEFVPAMHMPDKDSAVTRKFPNRCSRSSRQAPFANNAGLSAASYDAQQGCRRDYPQARLRLRKEDSHVTPASILLRVFTAGEKKVGAYFFFDSRVGSSDSFAARLESPGRYSSCSAAAKAFSKPTMSSPGRSVSKDSTSFRSSSSE